VTTPDTGHGCAHADCLFERDCLVVQADVELEAARADRLHRRHVAVLLCQCLGLPEDVVPVAIVAMYSPSTVARIRAGELLQDELAVTP
jgi:hypothetical protein